MKASVDDLIRDREATQGPFVHTATLAQALKRVMREARNWDGMPSESKEALEHAATALARILNGDASDPAHWNDGAAFLRVRALALSSGENSSEALAAAHSVETGISKLARMRTIPSPNSDPAS